MASNAPDSSILCPSSQPNLNESFAFGIAAGTVEEPRISYLPELHPTTEELLALTAPVTPTEVFRFAAPCANSNCTHFDGSDCRLARRIVENLDEVTDMLPACKIRKSCRWWQQEGKAACLRCPQVVTNRYNSPETLVKVALPNPN